MSVPAAIQASISNTVLGLMVGSAIEGVLPSFNPDVPLTSQVFEIFVQIGLNGVALGYYGGRVAADDPTGGLPFSWALFVAQPELETRVQSIGKIMRRKVSTTVQRTGEHLQAA